MTITKKQKEIFDYILDYFNRLEFSPTQQEIKDHFQFKSLGSVQRYIKYLISAGYLEKEQHARRGVVPANRFLNDKREESILSIPLLGIVAAGNPIEAIENCSDFLEIPPSLKTDKTQFALRVKGDSMIDDGIFDGDTIICNSNSDAKKGSTIVAIVNGEATVKRYYPKDGYIELQPANKTMSPFIITSGDFKIAGIVTGLIRSM